MSEQIYAIGRFTLEPHRQLLDGARPVDLGGKALDILSVLAAANGRLVTKDELMDAVWPNVLVEENAIQVHVSAARRALGQEAGRLATIWGRGYRLDAAPCDGAATPHERSVDAHPIDPEAAKLVAQAKALAGRVTPDALLRAIDLHERAIARDPGFSAAWTGLAGTLMVATVAGVLPPERRASARAMTEQAIRIDARSGAPLAIRAVLDAGECRWLNAEAGFRAAAERSPDDASVDEAAALNLWASIGHIGRAVELAESAACRAPASPNIALCRAHVAMLAGDLQGVAAQLETATLLGLAEGRTTARVLRAELALAAGDIDAATAHIAALLAGAPALRSGAEGAALAVGSALGGGGDARAASAIVTRLVESVDREYGLERAQLPIGQLICWQVRLGALDAAFALAARLVEERERSGFLAVQTVHPWWREDMHAFRVDGRFLALAERLDLPTAWGRLGPPDVCVPHGEHPVAVCPFSSRTLR